jgi:hypothetical protein
MPSLLTQDVSGDAAVHDNAGAVGEGPSGVEGAIEDRFVGRISRLLRPCFSTGGRNCRNRPVGNFWSSQARTAGHHKDPWLELASA